MESKVRLGQKINLPSQIRRFSYKKHFADISMISTEKLVQEYGIKLRTKSQTNRSTAQLQMRPRWQIPRTRTVRLLDWALRT